MNSLGLGDLDLIFKVTAGLKFSNVSTLSCLRNIPWTSKRILTRFAQICHLDEPMTGLDFGELT